MIDITIAFFITMVTCIVTYFWGKAQNNIKVIANEILDSLRDGGYIKVKKLENGEEELVKLDD